MLQHQQSLQLIDTDVTSDDEEHIYTRIPKNNSLFPPMKPYTNAKNPFPQ